MPKIEMGVNPISIFYFGVDNMVRITAKKILVGNVFLTFLFLFFACLVSLLGVLFVTAGCLLIMDKTVKDFFITQFGENALIPRIVVCVLAVFLGLILFSLGKNLRAKRIYEAVTGESAVCSLKKSFHFLLYYAIKTLFTLAWGFVYFLPCAICASSLVMSLSQGAMEKNIFYSWVAGCVVLLSVGFGFLFVTLQRYSVWQYYLCDEDNGVISALYKCLDKTKDRCVKIALFKLSMLGWILSCFLVLPIIYVLPYYNVSVALFSLDKGENEQEKKREEFPPAVFRIIRN